jgi:hypothetical protein
LEVKKENMRRGPEDEASAAACAAASSLNRLLQLATELQHEETRRGEGDGESKLDSERKLDAK